MQQITQVPFGTDITRIAGFAQVLSANDKLGAIDLIFENVGTNPATVVINEYTGPGTGVSGFSSLVGPFTVAAGGGVQTKSLTVVSKKIGFFGSGNTLVNITPVIRNRADLRGAQLDIEVQGRRGYGYDEAFDTAAFLPPWPTLPNA